MKFIKNIFLSIFLSFLVNTVCAQSKNAYDIVINLDDRIVIENQKERDIEIIKAAFWDWRKDVADKLFIQSEDCFRILLTPQNSTPTGLNKIASTLQIDLSRLPLGKKRIAVDDFEKKLDERLEQLYITAIHSERKADYSGANIWNYFNGEYIDEKKSSATHTTYLIILSDGYIDFEGKQKIYVKGEKYSDTSFLNDVRDMDWEEKISQTGLLQCNIDFSNTQVFMYEINPKVDFPYELQIFKKLYFDWFTTMNAANIVVKGRTNTLSYVSCSSH